MRRTPLHDEYAHHAKAVDFHGWALPLQFSGILEEHAHTRSKAGIFDCSHMGEFLIEGEAGVAAFDRLVFSDMHSIPTGRCRYTGILNAQGGIIDDVVVLRLSPDQWYVTSNAGPLEKVAALLAERVPGVQDLSGTTAKIDVQGPSSLDVLIDLGIGEAAELKYWSCGHANWCGVPIILTRAGYTGELGYELYVPDMIAVDIWRALLLHPEAAPCGLGARNILRAEMGYPLNGEDVWEEKTPLEADMERFIAWDSEFPGKERIVALRDSGLYDVLTAIRSADRRAPRAGFEIKHEGRVVGHVTSGTFGPSAGSGVGLAYLPRPLAVHGTRLTAGPRGMDIVTSEVPLYKGGTCRMKVEAALVS